MRTVMYQPPSTARMRPPIRRASRAPLPVAGRPLADLALHQHARGQQLRRAHATGVLTERYVSAIHSSFSMASARSFAGPLVTIHPASSAAARRPSKARSWKMPGTLRRHQRGNALRGFASAASQAHNRKDLVGNQPIRARRTTRQRLKLRPFHVRAVGLFDDQHHRARAFGNGGGERVQIDDQPPCRPAGTGAPRWIPGSPELE